MTAVVWLGMRSPVQHCRALPPEGLIPPYVMAFAVMVALIGIPGLLAHV